MSTTETIWPESTRIGLGPSPTIKTQGDTRPPLTKRQTAIVAFIHDHRVEHGYPPTLREIQREVGVKSPNGIMCHLKAIRKKGYLRWGETKARSIVLV